MQGLAHLVIGLLLTWLAFPPLSHAGGIPAKTLKELKAASVYIKVQSVPPNGKAKPLPASGSGFLVHVENGIGYIATNNHVINPPAGEVLQGNPRIVFFSGTPIEQTVEGHIVARNRLHDLAILKVTGFKDLPKPITMDLTVEALETLPVYALGFPFGGSLALGKANPAITITKGTISSLRYDNGGQVKLVQIDAEINPGNSGGPVVDEKGSVIGVAVSKMVQARTVGFAVPLKLLSDMMQGKLDATVFSTLWVVKNQAEVLFDAEPIDPLGKLKDATLHYRAADNLDDDELKTLLRPNKDGTFAPLKDATSVWLHMSRRRAEGRFSLKGAGQDQMRLVYQTSYVTANGIKVYSPINVASIDFTRVSYSERLLPSDPRGPGGFPQLTFPFKMQAGKRYTLQMHADPKDMDPRIIVQDAAGKVLAEDDGSGGLFDAILSFTPSADGEYQVVATSTKGMGPFTLLFRVENARDVGNLGPKGLSLTGELKESDSIDRVTLLPHQANNFYMKKGKSYIIDVKSKDFDPYLRLESMGNVQLKTEDIGGGGHSTLYFSPLQDCVYRVLTTAYDSRYGRFDLSIREAPAAKVYDVGEDGLKLGGQINNFDPLDVVNGKSTNFRCKIFVVKLKAKQKYQIDLASGQFNPILRIENTRGKELGFDDDSGGFPNARLMFVPTADDVYRIVATQFDQRGGQFELKVVEVK